MRDVVHWTNAALAFLLELAALGALAYWGFTTGPGTPSKVALGIGGPLLAAVVWGLFAAPRAKFRLPLAWVLVVKALVFGAAAAALYATGNRTLAVALAVIVVANTAIVTFTRPGTHSVQRDVHRSA
jgi:Protein of unknown function (DUF2568)